MPKQPSFNLSLTDELRAFVDSQCGPDGAFATPSEFLRALIRDKKDRLEAAALRQRVLDGYSDIAAGRTRPYDGDLRALLNRDGASP